MEMDIDITNSKIYLWGEITSSGNTYSFLRKIGIDLSQVWSTIVMDYLEWIGFSLDYTLTYIYVLLSSTTGTLLRFKAADGSIDFVKTSASSTAESTLSYTIAMSPNSQTVFFTASDGSSNGYIWRWQDGSANFEWAFYNGINPANTITSADANVLFMLDTVIISKNVEFRRVDFSNSNFNIWMSQIIWSSWSTSIEHDIIYDSNLSAIYILGNQNNYLNYISY